MYTDTDKNTDTDTDADRHNLLYIKLRSHSQTRLKKDTRTSRCTPLISMLEDKCICI